MNIIGRTYHVSSLKTNKHALPRKPLLNQGRSDFQFGFCICFIVDLLMQHREFCCVSLIGGSWRTWKTNQILGTHIPWHLEQRLDFQNKGSLRAIIKLIPDTDEMAFAWT